MAVTVKIPTQLRSITGGDSEASVDGVTTVGEVLDGLYDRYDGLRDRIAEDGDLRRFVNVYVGGEDIRFLDGLDTSVEDGDEVTILPAVAGGAWYTRHGGAGLDRLRRDWPGRNRPMTTGPTTLPMAIRPMMMRTRAQEPGSVTAALVSPSSP